MDTLSNMGNVLASLRRNEEALASYDRAMLVAPDRPDLLDRRGNFLGKLEDGGPSTSLATMLRVLTVLGLAEDIDLLAAQDTLGRSLQDSELKRAMPTPQKKIATPPSIRPPTRNNPTERARAALPVLAPPTRKKS